MICDFNCKVIIEIRLTLTMTATLLRPLRRLYQIPAGVKREERFQHVPTTWQELPKHIVERVVC